MRNVSSCNRRNKSDHYTPVPDWTTWQVLPNVDDGEASWVFDNTRMPEREPAAEGMICWQWCFRSDEHRKRQPKRVNPKQATYCERKIPSMYISHSQISLYAFFLFDASREQSIVGTLQVGLVFLMHHPFRPLSPSILAPHHRCFSSSPLSQNMSRFVKVKTIRIINGSERTSLRIFWQYTTKMPHRHK